MNFSADLVMSWIASYAWPYSRLAAMLMTMFVIGSQNVPVMVRAKLALVVTAVMAPVLPAMPEVPLFSGNGLLITVQQVLIGVAIGFASQLLSQTFVLAGQVIAMQTSLGFASLVDPINGGSSPVVGQFYLMLGALVFFAVDGHIAMLHLMMMSFTTLPVSTTGLSLPSMQSLYGFMTVMLQMALSVSLAAIVAMLLINFAFGVMTRAAPQLNIFSMGFAVSMVCGLLILWLSLGGFMEHFLQHWSQVQGLMCTLIQTQCEGG